MLAGRTLDLDQLSRLLDPSLAILTGGPRDLPRRQQTLRATIAWSSDNLDEPERRLFARLGVFAGGFSLDAAQAVCVDETVPAVFDGITSLVDKALLRPDHSLHGQPRFTMLQVIREYANDQLAKAGERDKLRRSHAGFYRQLVVDNARRLRTGDMRTAAEQHIADRANIRAALQWFIDTRDGGAAAQMGLSIWPFWFTLGRYTEGQEAMEHTLAADVGLTDDNRADVMLSLGMMVFERGDYDRAGSILQTALDRYVQRGDARGVATASVPLGVIASLQHTGDGDGTLNRAIDDLRGIDDRWGLALALLAAGTTLVICHREADAIAPLEEGARIARAGNEDTLLSNALIGLGQAHIARHDIAAATGPLGESLELAVGLANRETIARARDSFAAMAEQAGDPRQGATLLGAADGIRHSIGADVWAIDRTSHDDTTKRLQSLLGAETYARLAGSGANLSLDDVLGIAARTASS